MTPDALKKRRKFPEEPEPEGEVKRLQDSLVFVAQKHQASRFHYDFRLELDGVLKSWAVPKALLSRLRELERKQGPTAYLDTVFAAFHQDNMAHERQPETEGQRTMAQPMLDPLSERELEVLQLIARGASNPEIAGELVLSVDTVKRHVYHIFSKLGVKNRILALTRARELGLLSEES